MMDVDDLRRYAQDHDIRIDDLHTGQPSLCLRFSGQECIAVDTNMLESTPKIKQALAHEIGHCATGSFYNVHSKLEDINQREHRADVWAYKTLVPKDELYKAVRQGYTQMWELAEYFNLPQEYMEKIVWYYEGIE